MQNALNSTNDKTVNLQATDSRPPIFGRIVTSVFPKLFAFKHQPPGNIRTCMIPPVVFWEVLHNLPKLLKLRYYLKKKRQAHSPDDIAVAFYSDNLDEVNGIANNLRHVISFMRSHGYKAALAGNAFNTRSRGVIENGYVILLPRIFSMEQLGYANSELAIPHISPILRLIKRYPIDIIELETPSPGAWAVAFCAKIAGIKVISHYRTDVPTYTKTLVKAKWMHRYVLMLMQIFYGFSRPVVSPCKDYKEILHNDIKVPLKDIEIIRRGIPLESYSPNFRGKGTWEKFSNEKGKVRFVCVGRISKEKNLPLLKNLWMEFRKTHDDAELMFVGDGWYLDELKKDFASAPEVHFAGVQGGETLAGLYADADFLLFPSTTDTFGNVVVEALASGTPAIVSDKGGPQDIVFEKGCGYILPGDDPHAWMQKLEECVALKKDETAYQKSRENAYERSKDFTLEKAAAAQWEFYKKVYHNAYLGK